MAKGLEDTCFYHYNRLVSLNEVGGEPGRFGINPDQLHRWNIERSLRFPHTLTPLSTHDTKRSEDVRARINVLSEVPDRWFQAVERWNQLNQRHKRRIDDREAPDRNEEYFFYQNLLGAWPLEDLDDRGFSAFLERICGYMAKSIHEAKLHSSWQNPDPEYDGAIDHFVRAVLDRAGNEAFLDDFLTLQGFVSHHGMINSLSQTLLKIASPGVPDTYQGTELWDFSLVDPDNRRPVDYSLRSSMLARLASRRANPGELARDLVAGCRDGRIKLYTHWRALSARREFPGLFTTGEYRPLSARGEHEPSLFGFLRSAGSRIAVAAVPRLTTRLGTPDRFPLGAGAWQETVLELTGLPEGTILRNVFTGATLTASYRPDGAAVIRAAELFSDFPVALLLNK
jgi:(1->4)-alpha-D-glucan 1-alpha-D-glucosylmutase